MNPEHALRLLGIEAGTDPGGIPDVVRTRLREAEQRLEGADSPQSRTRFSEELDELREASVVLEATLAGETLLPGPLEPAGTLDDLEPQRTLDDAPSGWPHQPDGGKLDLRTGTILSGRYEIRERIGIGGMGAVFKAFDQDRREVVAVKVPLPGLLHRAAALERFHSEARLSSALSHPSIVNVFDVQREGTTYFLTMELLQGQNLREAMLQRGREKQLYSVDEAADIVGRVCDALHYAHQTTVHRDVKPENVFLCKDGSVKLMDFGIARAVSASDLTKTGSSMGTAYYMAPEQLRDSKDVDHRADQYSVGVMLYELLAGFVPAGRHEPLFRLRKDVSKRLAAVADRALAPRPEARFESTEALGEALAQSVRGGGLPAGAGLLAGGAAAVAALALAWTQFGGGAVDESPEPRQDPNPVVSVIPEASAEIEAQRSAAEEARSAWRELTRDQPFGLLAKVQGTDRDPESVFQEGQDALIAGIENKAAGRFTVAKSEWERLHQNAQALLGEMDLARAEQQLALGERERWETSLAAGASEDLLQGARPEALFQAGQQQLEIFDAVRAKQSFAKARGAWSRGVLGREAAVRDSVAAGRSELAAAVEKADSLRTELESLTELEQLPGELGQAFAAGARQRFEGEAVLADRRLLSDAAGLADEVLKGADWPARRQEVQSAAARLSGLAQELRSLQAQWADRLGAKSDMQATRLRLEALDLASLGTDSKSLLRPVEELRSTAAPDLRQGRFQEAARGLVQADEALGSLRSELPGIEAAVEARVSLNAVRTKLGQQGIELPADSLGQRQAAVLRSLGEPGASGRRAALTELAQDLRTEAERMEQLLSAQQAWILQREQWAKMIEARRSTAAQAEVEGADQARQAALAQYAAGSLELKPALDRVKQQLALLGQRFDAALALGPMVISFTPAGGSIPWGELPEIALEFDLPPDRVLVQGEVAKLSGTRATARLKLTKFPEGGQLGWSAWDRDQRRASGLLPFTLKRQSFGGWGEVVEQEPGPRSGLNSYERDALRKTGLPWIVRDLRTGIELVLVPPGNNRRGGSQGDEFAAGDELPAHPVRIAKPFYVGRTEVTIGQWSKVMGGAPAEGSESLPITNVKRSQVEEFLGSSGFSLPRESEWEYACRGGTTTAIYGATLGAVAWSSGNSAGTLREVGLKDPNHYGLYDMLGNALEMCSNHYDEDFYALADAQEGTVGPEFDDQATGSAYAARGGSFNSTADRCRVSARSEIAPGVSTKAIGFRVVRRPKGRARGSLLAARIPQSGWVDFGVFGSNRSLSCASSSLKTTPSSPRPSQLR